MFLRWLFIDRGERQGERTSVQIQAKAFSSRISTSKESVIQEINIVKSRRTTSNEVSQF